MLTQLQRRMIRLASQDESLRPHLLRLLQAEEYDHIKDRRRELGIYPRPRDRRAPPPKVHKKVNHTFTYKDMMLDGVVTHTDTHVIVSYAPSWFKGGPRPSDSQDQHREELIRAIERNHRPQSFGRYLFVTPENPSPAAKNWPVAKDVRDAIQKTQRVFDGIARKNKAAGYKGNPDGQDIYQNEIDHGEDQPLAGGTDVMKRLQDDLLHEQGRPPREKNPVLKGA